MTKLALKRPVTMLMFASGVCMLGYFSWDRLAVQLLPELIFPEVFVSAGMNGAAPEEVERQLAIPVEAELAALEGVKDLETTVNPGFFSTKVSFDPGVDMKFAILKLQQKMTALEPQLPQNSRVAVNRFDTSDFSTFLMQISIRGDRPLNDLREIAERRVKLRLEQVDGIVNVNVGGGERQNIGVEIDEDKCEAMGIPVTRVQQVVNQFHRQPEHLGQVITAGRILDVNLIGRVDDIRTLADLVVDANGPIRLSDVAKVGYGEEEKTEYFRINGKSSVGIFIQKDNQSNMIKVANAAQEQIDALNEELAREDLELVVNISQAQLISDAIDRVKSLAVTGAFLALIVLFLFLKNFRFVTILMIAIPVSLLITANFMYAWNLSINIVSLCGLALAIGMLVDNGIVVMENIFTHYQRGKSVREATLDGTVEVSRSIFASTGTTILVFLPVLFVQSDAQLFVRELALAVIFPLLASLFVALTIVPLLASLTLGAQSFRQFEAGRILEIYRLFLKSCMRHRIRTVSLVAVFLLLSLVIGATFILQQSSSPPPDRVDVYLTMAKGSTLDYTDELTRRFEEEINQIPDIKEARTRVQTEEAFIAVNFVEPDKRTQQLNIEAVKEKIDDIQRRNRSVELSFEPPNRGGGGGGRGGGDAGGLFSTEKGLRLRGHDVNVLRTLSTQIVQTLRTIEDVDPRSVRSELREGTPEIQIRGDRLRLAIWGLSMQQIMTAIWGTRAEGAQAATPFYSGGDDTNIQMQLRDVEERTVQDLENTKVMNSAGQLVPIREVATVRRDEGPGNIVRYNQSREVKISYRFTSEAETSKQRVETAETQIEILMSEIRMPRGFTLEKIEEENTQTVYYWMLAIGLILIFMFLAAQFESLFSPFVILGTIPTAIIGALFALTLTGTPLSLGEGAPMALLGLIVLLGIVVNNGIILLDRIAILRNRRNFRWQRAVMVASQNRVRPILMTSATTILGVLPLAFKQGTEFELWPPFAIVVLGGLTVSAFSTLVFIPVLYVALEQTREWLLKIGWLGLAVCTAVSGWLVYSFHIRFESWLWTSVITLPTWFIVLGLWYSVKQFFTLRAEKAAVLKGSLQIRISNLTKIYGAPKRFAREWHKQDRRFGALDLENQLPWTKRQLQDETIWTLVIGALLIYLHFFFESRFWLFWLTIGTVVWVVSARELYYRWRFMFGKPPKPRVKKVREKKRRFLFFKRKSEAEPKVKNRRAKRRFLFFGKKKAEPINEANSEEMNLVQAPQAAELPPNKRDHNGDRRDETVDPLHFVRRGGFLIGLAALAYLYVRTSSVPFLITMLVFTIIFALLKRTSRRIESGQINPELPEGRLKKIKRGIYALVKMIPLIRPPKPTVTALQGVNLEIGQGMFGLLGPNGAGKTTLMRSIVGVLDADRGSIKINGRDLNEHRELFHGAIGYLPQDFGLYENMTPREYLNYHSIINGIYEEDARRELIDKLIESVGLWERRDDKVKTFSGGMKQRVGIAQTLLNLPQIIVVDEPTAGLDPRERIRFRNLLAELAKERIVIFSTHVVEDISSTCNDLAVLNGGQVIYRGSPESMQKRAQGKVFEAKVPEADFPNWRHKLNIVQHSKVENEVRMRFISETEVPEIAPRAVEPTLEDAYVLLLQSSKKGSVAKV